jgi:chromosome segregation ATPase
MFRRTAFPLLCLLLICFEASANNDRVASREREMLRRAQQQLQQVQGQVSTLEQEKAKLGNERDLARKEAGAAQRQLRKLNQDLVEAKASGEQLAKAVEALKLELSSTQTRLTDSENKLAETATTLSRTQQTLARAEAEKRQLENIKLSQARDIASCENNNLLLYQTGRELMTRFEQKSCVDVLAQKEPFTGLQRVRIENLLEEYRDKLDEQKLIKPPGG